MLKIKRSKRANMYTLYDSNDFSRHTHLDSPHIARVIRRNVRDKVVPKTKSIRLIHSHLRVANDRNYINALKELLLTLEEAKNKRQL